MGMGMQEGPILVAIGANLPGPFGTPREACEWAVGELAALPGLVLAARSRWYAAAPVPPSGQPDYVNGAVRLEGGVEGRAGAHALLAGLHGIEAAAARVRGVRNGPRTLDLDLLAVGGLVVDDAVLTVPHPRLAARAFVLLPLCDVAPGWVHPVLRRTTAALLEELLAACAGAVGVTPLP